MTDESASNRRDSVTAELELDLIASALYGRAARALDATRIVTDSDFESPVYRRVWQSLRDSLESGGGVADLTDVVSDTIAALNGRAPSMRWYADLQHRVPSDLDPVLAARILVRAACDRDERQVAETAARDPNGVALAAARIEALRQRRDAVDGELRPSVPALRVMHGDELVRTAFPPIEWLVGDGLLYRGGVTLLVASHKRGKSLSALGLAAAGLVRRMTFPADDTIEFLGSPVIGAGPVLYLSGEGGPRLVKERLVRIEPYLGDQLRPLCVVAERPLPRIDDARGRDALAAVIRAERSVLVVVDPVSRFWRISDEADAPAMTALMGDLRAWAEDLNVALLLVHHDRKVDADARPSSTGGRGSSVLGNEVDVVINLWPDDSGDRRTSRVVFAGRWGEPDPCKVRVDPDSLLVEFVCRIGEEKRAPSGAAVPKVSDLALYEVIATRGDWTTGADLAVAVGLTDRQLRTRIRRLIDEGQVERRGAAGRPVEYRVAPPAQGNPK